MNLEKVYERYGKEGLEAAEELVSLIKPAVVDWLASLWDGKVGAFYYATSSAKNEEFFPDSESTQQALGLLVRMGLFGNEADFPERMKKKLGDFALSLQDPDGYFYHPQWKELMLADPEKFSSRRGRDFGQCLWLIRTVAKTEPRYPTALDNLKKQRQGGAVSAEANIPEHLRSKEAFIKYLDEMNINKGSYAKGHRLSSQAAQIKAAGLAEVCVEYLASKQNKENGTWEETVDINSINGVTKIGTAITSLGGIIPNATLAFKSAISVALVTDKGGAVTAPFNPLWTIMQMMNGFREGNMAEEYEACRKQLFDNGVGLMRAAYAKLSKYYYEPEGAFHYNWYDGASTSQGVPVSLGLHEGDVNATSLGIDTIFRIFELLELPVGKPFDREDGKKFLEKIGE